jgi:Holliday junction resolvase RusA-like endonuclease
MDAQALTFEVAGDPVPQPRARAGAGGRFFTPGKRIRVYKQAIAIRAALEAKAKRWQRAEGPVCAEYLFVFARPPSHWTRAGALATKAPAFPGQNCGDIDNLEKAVADALTASGVIWGDDAQICRSAALKRYAIHGEGPRTIVTVRRF